MTDRELEARLRAWYHAEVPTTEMAPLPLRQSLSAIPQSLPMLPRPQPRRRDLTLLAAAALILVGGALAAGGGLLRLPRIVPPAPSQALLATAGPSASSTPATSPTASAATTARAGGVIAYTRPVDKGTTCLAGGDPCLVPRTWIIGTDGTGAHELTPDGVGFQTQTVWSPDGSHLLFVADDGLFLADLNDGSPQRAETGCAPTSPTTPLSCQRDLEVAFSHDGRRIAFVRASTDADGYGGPGAIATMDLATGRVTVLNATSPDGGSRPAWSPDDRKILFSRYGSKDTGGLGERIHDALFIIDADGTGLHQISPPDTDAIDADWSPDGSRIVFVTKNAFDPNRHLSSFFGDLYTMRPDGTDVRRLTTDGLATRPSWTPDGRVLYTRGSPDDGATDIGWWTMDADGSNAAMLLSAAEIGVDEAGLDLSHPVWQPLGGAAIVPPPWTPAVADVVGPEAPTPSPSPTPDLGPGFSWGGTSTAHQDTPLAETVTKLLDGRILVAGGCGTGAELYDPVSDTFQPTGSMLAVRGGTAATLLRDGRVLFTGGYDCGRAGEDGIWTSAELYDPTTGTFSATGSMHTGREFHTSTLLADGRVLIAGGYTAPPPAAAVPITLVSFRTAESSASVLASAEIYDPATGTFTKTGSMSTFRDHHTAARLLDGRVLVMGGGGEGYASSRSADLFDPATGRFTKTGSLKTGRWLHTATLLPDGRVLVLGGRSPQDSVHDSAEIYDPRTGRFASAGSMGEGRQEHAATLLDDGRVLITGGFWSDGTSWRVLSSTEIFDPASGDVTATGSMGTPRIGHAAIRLDDGRVLIVGGSDIGPNGSVGVDTAVLYRP